MHRALAAMERWIGVAVVAGCVVALVVVAWATAAMADPQKVPAKVRVGTYDGRCVALAYSQTDSGKALLKSLTDAYRAAEQAKDDRAMKRARAALDRAQWTAHRQVFGNADASDCLTGHADDLAAIAQRQGVVVIVGKPDHLDASACETVDLTDAIVEMFHPDDATKQTIVELRKHTPATIGFDFED